MRWGLSETSKNTTTPRAPCGAKNWTLLGIVHHIVSKKKCSKNSPDVNLWPLFGQAYIDMQCGTTYCLKYCTFGKMNKQL